MNQPQKVLVLGATGYIGGRLVPRLRNKGYEVRCLVRNPGKAKDKKWEGVEIYQGDVLDAESLEKSMEGVDLVYYLVHLMRDSGDDLIAMETEAAQNVVNAAENNGVQRIIYLGGLGRDAPSPSKHLQSRHKTGDVLRTGNVPVTELAAGVIIGSGSASFEVMHHLVNKVPVMITPKWVRLQTQPIGISDILNYLLEAAENPDTVGEIFDVGCPEVITYREMMLSVARELGLKRYLIPVPVLTPKLSSYWLNFVTPVPVSIGRTLIESLTSNTVCRDSRAREVFSFQPQSFYEVVKQALLPIQNDGYIETHWTGASHGSQEFLGETTNVKADVRKREVKAPPERVFQQIQCIGGDNGWYFADFLWRIRGFIDKRLGGVGLNRGRRDAYELFKGEAVDFFRVEDIVANQRLLLKAEMKTGGSAWLEFKVEENDQGHTLLTQTAYYYPHGLIGYSYWFLVYPIHAYVFGGMIREIAKNAKKEQGQTQPLTAEER